MSTAPNTTKKKKMSPYKLRGRLADFGYALPALLFFIVFTYYPVVELFRISLTNWNLMKDNYAYVGFKNYIWLFSSTGTGLKRLTSSLSVTFLYTLGEVFGSCVLGLLLALLFNRMSRSFKIMRTLVILPKYVTISASALVFLWLYNESYGVFNQLYTALGVTPVNQSEGILNYALSLFGITGPHWLIDSATALTGILFLTAWRVVGYAMMIYLSAIKGLSQDYFEAAALDGANGRQIFRYITVPLIAPTTLFLGVTSFLAAMKVYQTIEMLTAGGPYEATNVIVYWIYSLAFKSYRLDRAAAVGVVFFLILLICTLVTMKWSDRKVNYDA